MEAQTESMQGATLEADTSRLLRERDGLQEGIAGLPRQDNGCQTGAIELRREGDGTLVTGCGRAFAPM